MRLLELMITFCRRLWGKGEDYGGIPHYGCECSMEYTQFADKLDEIAFLVDEIMKRRRLYLKSNLTLDMLAYEIGTNRTYLSRMFNRKKRMTFGHPL